MFLFFFFSSSFFFVYWLESHSTPNKNIPRLHGPNPLHYPFHPRTPILHPPFVTYRFDIAVPPKILPINPMTGVLREGMRAAITCQIMEGDLPITFRWERNGRAVSNNLALGTVIRRIDEFSSSLIIEQVTSAHTGNYTCIASNVAGDEKHIVPLTVNGELWDGRGRRAKAAAVTVPPRWTVEPADSSVAAGREATLHCQADGYPKPAVTWKKAVGEY